MRLIDADDFRDWILRQKRLSKNYTIMTLDEMKTIDLPEIFRPKARWLKISVPFNTGNECSNCGWGCSCSEDLGFNYCPNCGAKMDLGEGEA